MENNDKTLISNEKPPTIHLEHIYITTCNICIVRQIISSYHQHNAGSNTQIKATKEPQNGNL